MKEKLLQLLKSFPALAGRPDDFLDTLADDIQADIIRAMTGEREEDAGLNDAVEAVWHSDFGITLFNLYTTQDFPGKQPKEFSARKRIVKSAIETLLVEQCIDFECEPEHVPQVLSNVTDGNTLKRRLRELNTPAVISKHGAN